MMRYMVRAVRAAGGVKVQIAVQISKEPFDQSYILWDNVYL